MRRYENAARTLALLGVVTAVLLPAAVLSWDPHCIRNPVGFGRKVTGGAGGEVVKPRNLKELERALIRLEKITIDLTKTFDFTNQKGWVTSAGCFFDNRCKSGAQSSLVRAGTCNGRRPTQVRYSMAGLSGLRVKSDKTIMSSNGRGCLVGKGLDIRDAHNVIIRDICIRDINPDVIWAGDAITFSNTQNVWVHNVRFSNIGRQHLVTDQNPNTGITVSSCYFDGSTRNAAYCDGKHYWVMLFWGTNDEITLVNNRFFNTAGRLPHAGGWNRSFNKIHIVGNDFDTNSHYGIEAYKGAYILAEDNKYQNFKLVYNPQARGGYLALIDDGNAAQKCKRYTGQACFQNWYVHTKKMWRVDEQVFKTFSKLDWEAINGARRAACLH